MWLNTAAVGMLSLSPMFILQKNILPCIQCGYRCFECSADITDKRNLHPVSDSSHSVKKKPDTTLFMSGEPNKIL